MRSWMLVIGGVVARVGVLVSLAAAPAFAHHSFAAEFDANKPIKIAGKVTRMEWINPHSWIHVEVQKPNGAVENWMIETGTPNTLFRRGLTKESLALGTEVVVTGYRAKDGRLRANGSNVTLPNGQVLFVGSSGTGAPSDGSKR